MARGFSGNLIFVIVARMLCGNHLKIGMFMSISVFVLVYFHRNVFKNISIDRFILSMLGYLGSLTRSELQTHENMRAQACTLVYISL